MQFSFNNIDNFGDIPSDDDAQDSRPQSSTSQYTQIPHDDNPGYNGKYYVFTVNNYTKSRWTSDPKTLGDKLYGLCNIAGAIWSVEKGEQGTPHIQGYLQLDKKSKFKSLLNKIQKKLGCWLKPARGNSKENVDYISHTGKHANKAGDLLDGPFTFGELVQADGRGSRSDIDSLTNSISDGSSVKELCIKHPSQMLKYFGNAVKMVGILGAKKRNWMTELYIYTGVPGSGKSHLAHELGAKYLKDNNLDEDGIYTLMVPKDTKTECWFEGYSGQPIVIIDDFYGTIDIDFFKRLIDKYPLTVNIKNASTQFLARRVYVTSNAGWRTWWATDLMKNKHNEQAIQRRITGEKYFDKQYTAITDDDRDNFDRDFRCTDNDLVPMRTSSIVDHSDVFQQEPENALLRCNAMQGLQRPIRIEPEVLSQAHLDFLDEEFGSFAYDQQL